MVHAPHAGDEKTLLDVVLGPAPAPGPFTLVHPHGGSLNDILSSGGLGYPEDPETRRLLAEHRQSLSVNVEWQ